MIKIIKKLHKVNSAQRQTEIDLREDACRTEIIREPQQAATEILLKESEEKPTTMEHPGKMDKADSKPAQKAAYILRLLDKENNGRVFEQMISDTLVIGRKRELVDMVISHDKTISSRQCKVFVKSDMLSVVDLGGTNITYLNGQPLQTEEVLNTGDVLGFGRIDLRVTVTKIT